MCLATLQRSAALRRVCALFADLVRTHSQLGMIKALPPGIRPLWGLRTLQDLVKAQGLSVLLAGSLPRVCPTQVLLDQHVEQTVC